MNGLFASFVKLGLPVSGPFGPSPLTAFFQRMVSFHFRASCTKTEDSTRSVGQVVLQEFEEKKEISVDLYKFIGATWIGDSKEAEHK